jgi:hypothetical protein
MATLTDAEKAALLWPIKAKGAVVRFAPLGDPAIEQNYHKSMEQGRFLETSIADANNWLLQKKTLLNEYVISYTHMHQLAVDGELNHHHRVPKYIADAISILQTAKRLQQEIVSLNNAVNQNITHLLAIEQSMTNMVQVANQSLANLLNNICNWGIPGLPSIPNLFPDSLWNWNGFEFSPLALFAALKSNNNWNFNFTFKDCSFGPTSPANLFVTDPLSTQTYSGLVYGSANYNPPLDGQITPASQDLSDPAFVAQMQGTTQTAVYSPSFNPNENMLGATPDPHFIISDFQMPAATYVADIVSIAPQLRNNTIFLTDPDYNNPNFAVRTPALQKALIHSINLAQIVASNYDPFMVSAWLIYLDLASNGRGGVWIPNFEAVYQQQLQPSISDILTLSVPWNDVLPGNGNFLWNGTWVVGNSYVVGDVVVFNGVNYVALVPNQGLEPDINPTSWGSVPAGTVYSNAPSIQLINTIQSLSTTERNHLLWQLSYIEASLLGYTRDANFDAYQDPAYLHGPTGDSLDYVPTAIGTAQSSLILGQGTAEFPVPITFPSAMLNVLNEVIAIATVHIQNDINYISPRLANRFTYDQFAQATMVDRFSQFWRDFATNLSHFLVQDPYLVGFAITYPEILDGVLDPLADAANSTAFNSLLLDVSTRSRSWTPGTPLPNIPKAPITGLTNNSTPNINTNGWTLPPTDLDPVAFLARPDIIVLPIPVQIAMLRTNLSYAGVNKWSSLMQQEIQTQITTANNILTATQQIGFQVQINSNVITQTAINANIVTIVVPNAYQPGDNVLIEGTTVTPALNGQILVVLTSSATQFTATFANPNVALQPDTGTTGLVTYAPVSALTPVAFDTIVFDFTGNVTNRTTFTVQSAGDYIGLGQIVFLPTTPPSGDGVYTATVTQNGTPIATINSDSTQGAPQSLAFSFTNTFAQGDVVQVLASHNFPSQQIVNSSSFFGMTQSQVPTPPSGPTSGDDTVTFNVVNPLPAWYVTNVGTTVPAGTAVFVQPDGTVAPVDPFVPAITNIAINGSNVLTVTTNGHHFFGAETDTITNIALVSNVLTVTAANNLQSGQSVTFSGIATSTYLNGQTIRVLTASGTQFTASYTHANDPSHPDTGSAAGIGDLVVFSGVGTASFLDGVVVTVLASGLTTTVFTATYVHAAYPSAADTGSVLRAIDASGAVLAPFVDGITTSSGLQGQPLQVATNYGDFFTATGVSFTQGGLIYVGANGLVTQDYTTLITQVGWVIVTGRADTTTNFIFEPNIPTRTTTL